jgi:tetratricopeptide (TPR) repeat protein
MLPAVFIRARMGQNICLSRTPFSTAIRWAAVLAGFCGLILGSIYSINAAYSDIFAQQESIDGLTRAISITPGQSANYVKLAILVSDLDSAKSRWALARAVALNPYESSAWIELGLLAETAGDLKTAEADFLWAAQVNLQYLPRWTLANYYLRRGDAGNFWKWAKAASEMIYADTTAFFQLCGQVSEDGRLIERLNLTKPEIRARYAAYLIPNHIDIAGPAIEAVLRLNRSEDDPTLLDACDREIDAGLIEQATRLWNAMASSKRIRSSPVGLEGTSNKGEAFLDAVIWRGFDWRLQDGGGIAAAVETDPPGLRIGFSGDQAETCEPLYRYLPVKGGSSYVVNVSYRTQGVGPHSGLRWTVAEQPSGALLAESDELSSEKDADLAIRLVPSPSCRLVKITLAYTRARGTTRIQGSLLLRDMTMRRED